MGRGAMQTGMRLGLRAVGLENRPTCAAHLDIGRRCKSLSWAPHVARLSEPSRPGDPSVGWRHRLVRFLGCHMRARRAHLSKRTTGARPKAGALPCGLRALARGHPTSEVTTLWRVSVTPLVISTCVVACRMIKRVMPRSTARRAPARNSPATHPSPHLAIWKPATQVGAAFARDLRW